MVCLVCLKTRDYVPITPIGDSTEYGVCSDCLLSDRYAKQHPTVKALSPIASVMRVVMTSESIVNNARQNALR